MEQTKTSNSALRLFYFWAGIIATIAYRIIIVLNNFSSTLVMISWYIGTVGFIIYFIHRYQISQKRQRLIIQHSLTDKINKSCDLSEEDKSVLQYILSTLKSTKEKWNYIFIFVMSGLALIVGIYLDFLA
ncbi:MAG: hypothetical protein V1853_03480 [bacterium]